MSIGSHHSLSFYVARGCKYDSEIKSFMFTSRRLIMYQRLHHQFIVIASCMYSDYVTVFVSFHERVYKSC